MSTTTKLAAGVNAALGAWLIVVPFLFVVESAFGFWNNVLVGAGILAFSGYNAWLATGDDPGNPYAAAVSALLGLWLLVVSLFAVPGEPFVLWSNVIVGVLVAEAGGYNAWKAWSGGSTDADAQPDVRPDDA
ncbi:MAG: hypothetical protein ABEJ31_12285 [Haloarculaceae archaeon]